VAPIVVIRVQTSAPLGIAAEALDGYGADWTYLDVFDTVEWPDVDDIRGIVALGGGMNVDRVDTYPFLQQSRELLRAAVDRSVPVMGICLGAQMLARALGAEVKQAPSRVVGFRKVTATPEGMDDPVLAPFAPESKVFYFHEDAFDLPDGAELLFSGPTVANQAYRFGESAYGVQWHLEVNQEIVSDWCNETPILESEWGVTKAEVLKEAEAMLPAQQDAGRKTMVNFARLCESRRNRLDRAQRLVSGGE
jgi:GMP synthase (glutamine-hydrolysing)